MQYDLLPDRVTGPGCGFDNAVRLRAAGVRLGTAPSLSCPMALSFFMWERYALQPAARQHYGQKVVAIDHLGSYACRNVNRGEGEVPGSASLTSVSASRSRHATANALDVAGLTLADGRRITVLKGWSRDDGTGAKGTGGADTAAAAAAATPADDPAALLLRDAHRGACRFFDGVLGPDYNAVHRDHFHLETGGYTMCR